MSKRARLFIVVVCAAIVGIGSGALAKSASADEACNNRKCVGDTSISSSTGWNCTGSFVQFDSQGYPLGCGTQPSVRAPRGARPRFRNVESDFGQPTRSGNDGRPA